jgi:hypothetical protein
VSSGPHVSSPKLLNQSILIVTYSGRKITESLRNVTVRGEKRWKEKGGRTIASSLSDMYSITENIYYSQLSSFAILLQPEPNCFTSYNTKKGLSSLFLCAIVFPSSPASHVSTSNGKLRSQLFCVQYSANCRTGRYRPHHPDRLLRSNHPLSCGLYCTKNHAT